MEWQNSKGERCRPALGDTATKVTVWKRHRVPFEEANETYANLAVQGGLEFEPYLEEIKKEPYEEW
jgi:hypothetical protein